MPTYAWLVAVGVLVTLFAANHWIWDSAVPGKRDSHVPIGYRWRLLTFTVGALLLGGGLFGYVSAKFGI